MPNSSIWVLVANEHSAAICKNTNGNSRLLQSISLADMDGNSPADGALGADGGFSRKSRHAFIGEMMSALSRGANARAYDGVIIMANAQIIEELRRFRTSAVTRLLIAEIVGEPQKDLQSLDFDANLAFPPAPKYGTLG